jgi:uncharacterized membrane protein
MHWLRRSFLTGLVVTVPLFISVTALVWTFRAVEEGIRIFLTGGVAVPATLIALRAGEARGRSA